MLRRLGVCFAWACFIISCALWVWAEAPRGPSASFRLSDPDGGMIPKPLTPEEQVQMDIVNKEFAELLSKVPSAGRQVKERKPPSLVDIPVRAGIKSNFPLCKRGVGRILASASERVREAKAGAQGEGPGHSALVWVQGR